MRMAAANVVYAKICLSLLGSVSNENRLPRRPPTRAARPNGRTKLRSRSTPMVCPRKPVSAVAATMAEDVPTAMRMGTPHARTRSGILNEPPDIPTIPATKPVAVVTGRASHKLTVYSCSPYFLDQYPNFPSSFFL